MADQQPPADPQPTDPQPTDQQPTDQQLTDQQTMEQSENPEEFDFEMEGEDMMIISGQSEMEEEDDFDEISRMGDSSDDPEQKRRYMEYLSLIKEIGCQNQTIEDIKTEIKEQCAKPCKTRCDMKNIKRLRVCMEQENLKLQCLMTKAMQLQNFGSHRKYHEIPIATTLDEDNLAPYVCSIPPSTTHRKTDGSDDKSSCHDDKEDKGSKQDQQLKCLCKALCKMKICCPEDKKLVKEIAAAMLCKSKRQQKDPCARDNEKQLQSALRKTKALQQTVCNDPGSENLDKLKQKIACMQLSVNKLKEEIVRREQKERKDKENVCQEEPELTCSSKRTTKADQIDKLKENYLYLLAEYAKKDCQLKEMEMRMKSLCGSCNGKGKGSTNDIEESELNLLRGRVNELKEEQVEFKCIMKEQSQQLEDYRNKYLSAQQKVEEQSSTLDKLNMNNKRIEKQINTEVKEIRGKFQEKLNELLHFPKLLENEQLKLASACKEKEELQSKLHLICKELQSLKSQTENPQETKDCRPQLAKCQHELMLAQKKIEDIEKQRDMFCEQLQTTQEDLDTLRSESAKIIARTKERAESTKQQQQEHINQIEKDLARCRATACLSVSDRESVIREMQGQLNTLSYSFDAAQKQIKTLRNHIAYVSNENCFPMKC